MTATRVLQQPDLAGGQRAWRALLMHGSHPHVALHLDSGNLAPDMFVLAFINGAKSATGSAADAQSLANKEAVGLHFALDWGLTNVAWGAQVMAHVDATAQSVAAAKQVTDAYAHQAVTTDPHLLLPIVGVHSEVLVGACGIARPAHVTTQAVVDGGSSVGIRGAASSMKGLALRPHLQLLDGRRALRPLSST